MTVSAGSLDHLVERCRVLAATLRRPVVAVDGRSGSGKSALCDAVVRSVDGAVLVRLEDMYAGWDGLAAAIPVLVRDLLVPWRAGGQAGYTEWDWSADRPGRRRLVPSGALLVVDGVGSGAAAASAYVDLLVWLELPAAERYERAMARDGEVYRGHWTRWAAQEDALYADDDVRSRAEVVLRG